MSPRLPACDPCRKAKLACGHEQPVCVRCRTNNKQDVCIYRSAPFKRKRSDGPSCATLPSKLARCPATGDSPISSSPNLPLHPNPGYLGASSHVSIFSHLDRDESEPARATPDTRASRESTATSKNLSLDERPAVRIATEQLKQLFQAFDLDALKSLISFWRATGANLALAEPFVDRCAQGLDTLLRAQIEATDCWNPSLSQILSKSSSQPLDFSNQSTVEEFSAQFLGRNLRWEALGIFLAAVIRATMEISFFPALYKTDIRRYELVGLTIRVSDSLMEICLSLDCLNDLQLVFQYENFIAHSYVFGIQSYPAWRKLGDVISSILALGYHERPPVEDATPLFLTELRKTAFARVYSADKNFSIFLGRSPRMSKQFCHFQVPLGRMILDSPVSPSEATHDGTDVWSQDSGACYRADTRWSALCASLKEEILVMLFENCQERRVDRVRTIEERAEAQWRLLPSSLRLEGSAKRSNRSPFERDFLISARLNHLHVLFLLRLLCLDSPPDPDKSFVELAQEILSLVVEAIVLRGQIINSGTSTVWKVKRYQFGVLDDIDGVKVAHYGLPAAGIVLLAMLRQKGPSTKFKVPRNRILQDLGVLVAEIEMGTIVRPDEPNFSLLSAAAETIQRFLDRNQAEESQTGSSASSYEEEGSQEDELWNFNLSLDPWDFEIGFWESLAEHPSLFSSHAG